MNYYQHMFSMKKLVKRKDLIQKSNEKNSIVIIVKQMLTKVIMMVIIHHYAIYQKIVMNHSVMTKMKLNFQM